MGKGPHLGAVPTLDAGAVDGALDLAGAGRGEPWGGQATVHAVVGERGVSPTLQCPGSECVFGLRVFFNHLSVQLIFLGSSVSPTLSWVLDLGTKTSPRCMVQGTKGLTSGGKEPERRTPLPPDRPPAAQLGDSPPADTGAAVRLRQGEST